MLVSVRRVVPAVLVECLGLVAGCGSNNKGKIEGKWKMTGLPPNMSEQDKAAFQMIGEQNVSIVLEFTANGKMTGNATVTFAGQTKSTEFMSADYKLGTGDWVNFTNMKPTPKNGSTNSKDKVVINGDSMTIDTEKGEKITLTRLK